MPDTWKPLTLESHRGALHAFERGGRDDLATLVLLHGAGGNALAWTPMLGRATGKAANALPGRRVLLVDLPGHGRSAAPSTWEMGATAAHVREAVRTHVGEGGIVWGGHSWGGKIAGLVAGADAEAKGLVLVDPSPCAAVPIDLDAFVDDVWREELAPRASVEEAAAAARALPQWQPWDEETAAAFAHGLARRDDGSCALRPSREELFALCSAVLHVDASEGLRAAAGVPTLLLVAAESRAWQEFTNMALYERARVEVIDGHHWIHLVSATATAAAIDAWLAEAAIA